MPNNKPNVFLSIFKIDDGSSVENKNTSNVSIFPNPANEYIEVQFNSFNPMLENIVITNLLGVRVMEIEKSFNSYYRIDVSSLPRGVYYINYGEKAESFTKM